MATIVPKTAQVMLVVAAEAASQWGMEALLALLLDKVAPDGCVGSEPFGECPNCKFPPFLQYFFLCEVIV